VKRGDVVVDVGANVGALTIPFARMVGPRGAVFAFEPQPFVYYLLCANVALNGLQHVVCHRLALAHEVGVTLIKELDYTCPGNFGGFRVYDNATDAQVPTNVSTIDAWRLNKCALIKVDVEGMERMVLRGAYGTIRRLKPVLWVECEPELFTTHLELIDWISQRLGYRVERVSTPLYQRGNWRGDTENVFGDVLTHNLLCMPR
jgi:FkbM family methyltransferase